MRTLPIFALVLGLSAPAFAAVKGSTQDETALNNKFTGFVEAWNKHDVPAMASTWATDGTLINPFGRIAKGRDEIQMLFQDEQSKAMKKSTASATPLEIRWVTPEVALADATFTISGMTGPDGKPAKPMKSHVSLLMVKSGDNWNLTDARAFNFMPEPKKAAVGRKAR